MTKKLSLVIYLLWFRSVPIGVLRMTNFALAIPSWNAFSAAALCFRIRSSSASRSSLTVKEKKSQLDFFPP